MNNKFTRLLPLTLLSGLFLAVQSKAVAAGPFNIIWSGLASIWAVVSTTKVQVPVGTASGQEVWLGTIVVFILGWSAFLYYLFRAFIIKDERFTWQAGIVSFCISVIISLVSPVPWYLEVFMTAWFGTGALIFLFILGLLLIFGALLFGYLQWGKLSRMHINQATQTVDALKGLDKARSDRGVAGLQNRAAHEKEDQALDVVTQMSARRGAALGRLTAATATGATATMDLAATLKHIQDALQDIEGGGLSDVEKKTEAARLGPLALKARDLGNVLAKKYAAWVEVKDIWNKFFALISNETTALDYLRALAGRKGKVIDGALTAASTLDNSKPEDRNEAKIRIIYAELKQWYAEKNKLFKAWDDEAEELESDTEQFEKDIGNLSKNISSGQTGSALALMPKLMNESARITDLEKKFDRLLALGNQVHGEADAEVQKRLAKLKLE